MITNYYSDKLLYSKFMNTPIGVRAYILHIILFIVE